MKRLFTCLMVVVAGMLAAPRAAATDAGTLVNLLAEILNNFNDRHPGQNVGLQVAMQDLNGDVHRELLLVTMDTTVVEAYDVKASVPGRLVRLDVDRSALADAYCVPFLYAWQQFNDLDHSSDLTLRHRPMFASPDLAKNTFVPVLDHEDVADIAYPNVYDYLIFKPHINPVTFVRTKNSDRQLLYKLNDPKVVKTMFRGYGSGEAAPVLVPHQFLETHNVLQYSRWKSPEPIQKLTPDARSAVQAHYSGWRITDSRWLADCPTAERTFYAVTFAPRDGKALAAVVCIAEGEVASAIEFEGEDGGNGNGIWFDDPDYFEHAPEIMAMMATQFGFEMYVRWPSMEGTHYAIWREVLDQWVVIQDDYDYWYANEE